MLEALIKKKIKIRKRKLGYKDWWNRKCTRGKRKIRKVLVKWRRGKKNREDYVKMKKKWKELIKKRQNEKRMREEKELKK